VLEESASADTDRLKCAILGSAAEVALHKAKGTPLPEEWRASGDELSFL